MVEQGRVPYHEHNDSDIRAALAAALEEKSEQDDRRARLTWIAQLAAYVLIVGVAVLGAFKQEQLTDDLCSGAAENRAALRSLVTGVRDLGTALVVGDAEPGDYISPQQTKAMERINDFEREQLKTLELPICER